MLWLPPVTAVTCLTASGPCWPTGASMDLCGKTTPGQARFITTHILMLDLMTFARGCYLFCN